MGRDTDIGGTRGEFPATRHSVVAEVASRDEEVRSRAWEALVRAYWKPVYKYLRLRFARSNEDAKDLTQAFFARAIERDFFDGFDPARARFRTWLRICLDRFVANADAAASAQKRGGGTVLELDFDAAESEVSRLDPPAPDRLDDWFRAEWVRELFARSVADLEALLAARGRLDDLEMLRRYDLDPGGRRPTYEELAAALGVTVVTVTNRLAAARRELRRIVLEQLRRLTTDEAEFRDEVRVILGVDEP